LSKSEEEEGILFVGEEKGILSKGEEEEGILFVGEEES
jgi:hypothetical protein